MSTLNDLGAAIEFTAKFLECDAGPATRAEAAKGLRLVFSKYVAALATQQAGQGEAKISTEHGPWLPSTYGGEEGETYCQRCLLRSKFMGQRKCDPHIVYAPPAPQQPEALAQQEREIADRICKVVAELPDRNSPEDWPEAMLVTSDELREIVSDAIRAARSSEGGQP